MFMLFVLHETSLSLFHTHKHARAAKVSSSAHLTLVRGISEAQRLIKIAGDNV